MGWGGVLAVFVELSRSLLHTFHLYFLNNIIKKKTIKYYMLFSMLNVNNGTLWVSLALSSSSRKV